MKITWRPYQVQCKKSIKNNYDKGITKQLVVQATGTGKRIAAVNLMNHFKRSLFIAHREELIEQAYQDIDRFFPMQAGIVKGSRREFDKRIVVASVQTLYNHLDKIDPSTFNYIAVDEAHHYMSRTYLATIRHFKPDLLTGWTATPKRLDGFNLSNLFQKITFEYPIEKGIKEGFLAPIEAYQIKTNVSLKGVRKTAGDFNQKQLSEKVDIPERNKLIVQRYKKYAKGEQAIAFCVDIDHCYHLKEKFVEEGIKAEVVVSDQTRCPNRSELIADFKESKFTILINVMIATEGFDYSDAAIMLGARPTESEALYTQMIGRFTRIKSDKFREKFGHDKAIILDFVDNTANNSLVTSYKLEEDKALEDKMFMPSHIKDKIREAREKRERRMNVSRNKDSKIDLLKLPKVKIWESEKMEEPATEAQLKWIKDIGLYDPDTEYTKAMASEMISNQPAKHWQIEYLARNGYDIRGRVTYGQYQLVKRRVDMQNKYKPVSD